MLSLSKTKLPSTVNVDGVFYSVKTDFHWWLSFYKLIKNQEVENLEDLDFMYEGKVPADRMKGYEELLNFLQPEKKLPRPSEKDSDSSTIVYDFEIDSELIFSAFMEQYRIDLFDSSMHWFKFLALFDGLHNTRFNEVVSCRCYDENDKTTFEESQKELKRIWTIDLEGREERKAKKVQEDLETFNSIFWGC